MKPHTSLAYFDPRGLFDASGNLKDIKDLDPDIAQAICGVDFVNLHEGEGDPMHCFGQLRKIRMTDRLRAQELLGRHQKLFVDKLEHESGEQAMRIFADKLDFSKLDTEDLAKLAAAFTRSPVEQG